eukprot:gene1171-3023_t
MKTPLFVMWYDGFKAYDSINLGCLFAYLTHCGMSRLCDFLFTLYTTAHWAFITGHGRSTDFISYNGGTQGCPATCPLYVLYITPLLFKLDITATQFFGVPLATLSYVDDLHTVAVIIATMRQQIEVVVLFNDLNRNIVDPRKGKYKMVTNPGGLQLLWHSEPILVKGFALTEANGNILTQARILGGCLHTVPEPCKHRLEQSGNRNENLVRCTHLPVNPPTTGNLIETFVYSKYLFAIETCTDNFDEWDRAWWPTIRGAINNGPNRGGYSEAYELSSPLSGRGCKKPSNYDALKAIHQIHRVLHGGFISTKILRGYWQWIQEYLHVPVWEATGATMATASNQFLFYNRIQQCLDRVKLTLGPTFRNATEVINEAHLMGANPLPQEWDHFVAATDGGLLNCQATEGAVALRVENNAYAEHGDAVCEWAAQ